ncbi:MAG: hypothetical protein NTX44_14600 [Ignavibacteriales bacterium]|nr:hypothetical protein [Ignavibacteriales bacterium]
MEAYRSSQTEASLFHGIIVYLILPIALTVLILTWILLRKFTLIWIDRPPSLTESILAGFSAWLFLLSIITWFGGIVFLVLDFLSSHDTLEIWTVVFSALVTGYGADFYLRSKSDFSTRDTQDYLKEAIQFRRSAQSRLDLLALIRQRQKGRMKPAAGNDPESLQRARLQVSLSKEKNLDAQLALLREGTTVDISEIWYMQPKIHSLHPFYEKVHEARIEPKRKRFSIIIDFPEFEEAQFKDEMVVLRFNRQVYDFFQSMNTESWLKPYAPFFESYFLMCRAKRLSKDNTEVFYPFMKAGMPISELHKLEGFYFNPRKLSEIAAIAFNHGAPV